MKLMPILRRCSVSTTASVVLLISAGCAQGTAPAPATGVPVAAVASTAAPSAPAAAAIPSTAAYTGRFVSDCMTIADELHYNDVMDLTPRDNGGVDAQYTKVFYGADSCAPDTRIVSVALPLTRWDLQETVTVGGQKVERVLVTLQAGKLSAQIAPKAKITETDESITMHIGKDNIPVARATEGSVDKDLRLIKDGKLYMGDPESPVIDGYPSALSKDLVFVKQ